MVKVAYLGPKNTFTHKIARAEFPADELIDVKTIMPIIYGIDENTFDIGVVPAENFHEGEVRETFRYLYKSQGVFIFAERNTQVVHCLGALKNRGRIESIFSKDQALNQCADWCHSNYPHASLESASSTAAAAKMIKEKQLLNSAAIASRDALLDNELEILAEDLLPGNKTRFFLIGRNDKLLGSTGDDKTFFAFTPRVDRPGLLHYTTGFFSDNNINLEYFSSRPDNSGGYTFYVEAKAHMNDSNFILALAQLRDYLGINDSRGLVKILGSYPNSHWKEMKK